MGNIIDCSLELDPSSRLLENDLLPSWREGPNKTKILNFFSLIQFIPEEERHALFDLDGTLVIESPLALQARFLLKKFSDIVKNTLKDLVLNVEGAFLKILRLQKKLPHLSQEETIIKMVNLKKNFLVDSYRNDAKEWINEVLENEPLVYQPMRELIDLLQKHKFKVYVVSGSEQEFIRTIVPKILNIASENIFGTEAEIEEKKINGIKKKVFTGSIAHVNNAEGKVETIRKKILPLINQHADGKITILPPFACGNSDGDKEMLIFTQALDNAFTMLIHHTDGERETEYGHFRINGGLSRKTREEVEKGGGLIVDMKEDWETVF